MSEIHEKIKILLIPLDNRPVSYTLPRQIASLQSNIKFLAPPREFLGGLTEYSDIDKISEWLDETLKLEKVDYIVVSLDTITYGGLIPSRRIPDKAEEIIRRLNNFRNIIESNNAKAKILAFSSIMRISDSYVNEEEKEYWDKFGKEIFKYSYLKHKTDMLKSTSELSNFGVIARNEVTKQSHNNEKLCDSFALLGMTNYEKELLEIKNKIPPEILEDYLRTRERNFCVNRYYLNLAKDKFFDYLVFSKDDTGEFGINIQEAQALEAEIQDNQLSGMAVIQTGADEIPSDLVSRALVDNFAKEIEKVIKIYPVFSTKNGKNIISRYEDKTISESVAGQIKLCGAQQTDSAENADIILLVHTPENIQNDHCLNIHIEPENKEAVAFCTDFVKNSQKPVIIADIACANGGDNLLVLQILGDIKKIYGYAGWNTTGNTLGSVISTGISRYIAEQTNNFDAENFKKLLLIRLADDWAYQTIVRQIIRATTDFADTKTLREELIPLVLNIAKKLDYDLNLSDLKLGFPWNRTFETEIDI